VRGRHCVSADCGHPRRGPAATCPDGRDGAGWTLSTSTFDNRHARHALVGNGYLSQRVPPVGTGYMATGEKTGWPLYTPRYDGAFVAGVYGRDRSIVDADGVARTIDAAIPPGRR
jgi:trehalose/maltose hydrolase-like predicted phosphorylase